MLLDLTDSQLVLVDYQERLMPAMPERELVLANALRLAEELRRRGYEAEVSEAVMGGKLFHRVRIGRFARRPEAEVEARCLAEDGFPARVFP